MKKVIKTAACVVLMGATLGACASHKFVRQQISDLEQRRNAIDAEQNARIDAVGQTARDALNRANAAHQLAEGKFLFATSLSDDSVTFKSGKAVLSAQAQGRLVQLIEQLKAENKNVYVEIQGHTDSLGSDAQNMAIGQRRADAVRLFMSKQGVPLNRMSAISYGETAPVAANTTREGRSANRRVTIIVLS